jgi:hypothetical protein
MAGAAWHGPGRVACRPAGPVAGVEPACPAYARHGAHDPLLPPAVHGGNLDPDDFLHVRATTPAYSVRLRTSRPCPHFFLLGCVTVGDLLACRAFLPPSGRRPLFHALIVENCTMDEMPGAPVARQGRSSVWAFRGVEIEQCSAPVAHLPSRLSRTGNRPLRQR